MSSKIVLSPEISALVKDLICMDEVFFKSPENQDKCERLLDEILLKLPKGVIGFTFHDRVYLKKQIVESLSALEDFTLLPEEEQQPKKTKK